MRVEHEDRDLPVGLAPGTGRSRARPRGPAPTTRRARRPRLARLVVVLLRAVLQLDVRVLPQVPVPDRMLRGAAERGDDGVLAVVLDAHEGGLAQLARLRADGRQHDDRAAPERVRLLAVRRLEGLGLPAGPSRRARLVLAFEWHRNLLDLSSTIRGLPVSGIERMPQNGEHDRPAPARHPACCSTPLHRRRDPHRLPRRTHDPALRRARREGEPFERVNRFVEADETGADARAPGGSAPTAWSTARWSASARAGVDLQRHAAFPADRTTSSRETLELPIGTRRVPEVRRAAREHPGRWCVRQCSGWPRAGAVTGAVVDGHAVRTFWFSLAHPGMPVRYEQVADAGGIDRTTMVGDEIEATRRRRDRVAHGGGRRGIRSTVKDGGIPAIGSGIPALSAKLSHSTTQV